MLTERLVEFAYEAIAALLSPACVEQGLSYKTMPNDKDAGVIRNAMLIPFVTGFSIDSSASSVASRLTGMAKIQAYVLILSASQVGPRSATWSAEVAIEALNGREHKGAKLYTKQLTFSSFSDGVWQYRLPVDLVVPVSTVSTEIRSDIDMPSGGW